MDRYFISKALRRVHGENMCLRKQLEAEQSSKSSNSENVDLSKGDLLDPEFIQTLKSILVLFSMKISSVTKKLVMKMLLVGVPFGILEPSIFDETDEDQEDQSPSKLRLLWERIDPGTKKRAWVSAYIHDDHILLVLANGNYQRFDAPTDTDLLEVVRRTISFLVPEHVNISNYSI